VRSGVVGDDDDDVWLAPRRRGVVAWVLKPSAAAAGLAAAVFSTTKRAGRDGDAAIGLSAAGDMDQRTVELVRARPGNG